MSKMGLWILTRRGAVIFTTLMLGINGFSQSYYCKQSVLNAVREIPKLTYDCPGSQTDSDESILKIPERVKALRKFAGLL